VEDQWPLGVGFDHPVGRLAVALGPVGEERDATLRDDPGVLAGAPGHEAGRTDRRVGRQLAIPLDVHHSGSVRLGRGNSLGVYGSNASPGRITDASGSEVIPSRVRAGSRTCGDVWFRQGLVTGEREPRMPLGLVNQVAKRSTWQPPVDSRSRCLGSRVSVEAASSSRVVEASSSGDAIRTSVA